MRKPFQGVWNIVRFNWDFYVLAFGALVLLLLLTNYVDLIFRPYLIILAFLIFIPTFISLGVSYYVYDVSDLYKLNWIDDFVESEESQIININAGFDETSILLKNKFPNSELLVFDFYDPKKHTEVSIKRARKAYPIFPNTKSVTATYLPTLDNSVDKIFVIFAAHEIRNEQERIAFFKELKRVIKPTGEIIITEHLRDVPNFLAYNIGFLHFYSKPTWLEIFQSADFTLKNEQKLTPFISTFTLTKYGVAS
jgi:ubiquinone/menaquinone biosynthesis C-methylase UbiE